MFKFIGLLVGSFVFGICLALVLIAAMAYHDKISDSYAREHIIQLYNTSVRCTGIEVKGPSGKIYTLTAAHCKTLIDNGEVQFKDEHLNDGVLRVIDIDDRLDLLLLDGAMTTGFGLASRVYVYEDVHTMSHGLGLPAYRTDGIILMEALTIDPPICNGFACMNSPSRILTTAPVVPGSSGGPLLDSSNDLVGVIHAYNPEFPLFSYHASLDDVKYFMKGR